MKTLKGFLLESSKDTLKKYKNDILDYLASRKWDDLHDIIAEFEYGDEYYDLIDEILNHLKLNDGTEEYDDIRYGVGPIIREYLKKNKMWR
jgi:hypothetical protein